MHIEEHIVTLEWCNLVDMEPTHEFRIMRDTFDLFPVDVKRWLNFLFLPGTNYRCMQKWVGNLKGEFFEFEMRQSQYLEMLNRLQEHLEEVEIQKARS